MPYQTENELLKALQKTFAKTHENVVVGIGDDAAVVKQSKEKLLVYTCDSQVENTHFKTTEIDPTQLGFRGMTAGISDIAAMGATPTFCLVSLFLPKHETRTFWIDGINKGIKKASTYYDVSIIGGNITKSQRYAIDIFAIGEVDAKKLLTKKGANVGDGVFVTGFLGDAHTGWELLQNTSVTLTKTHKHYLKTHHFTPFARVKEAKILANLTVVTAMTDLSDGLATDMLHLCQASSVGVTLDARSIPISPAVNAYAKATHTNPLTLALEGGEDFALCFTAPLHYKNQIMQTVKKQTGTSIYHIGTICSRKQGTTLLLEHGEKRPLSAIGFDNLA